MIQFRRGLTFYQRQKLRAEILEKELQRGRDRAAAAHVSSECWKAMRFTGQAARSAHSQCRAEDPGGRGCLCACHDVTESGVLTGTMTPV